MDTSRDVVNHVCHLERNVKEIGVGQGGISGSEDDVNCVGG